MNDYIPAEDVEAPISFTGKIGGNLMTIRGNDAQQFLERLDEFVKADGVAKVAEFNDLTNAVGNVKEGFSSSRGNSGGGQRSGGNSGNGNAGSSDTQTHPEGLKCDSCGSVVVYKKIAKGNRTFELWTCPNQRSRNDGHHSEFIN